MKVACTRKAGKEPQAWDFFLSRKPDVALAATLLCHLQAGFGLL
jgi:hypothetical protein